MIDNNSGHSRSTYGIGFQCDGSLCATGDLGGNGHLWDLRSGKSIWTLRGHSKMILSVDFSPNGCDIHHHCSIYHFIHLVFVLILYVMFCIIVIR
jgi:WD40 repeat protein